MTHTKLKGVSILPPNSTTTFGFYLTKEWLFVRSYCCDSFLSYQDDRYVCSDLYCRKPQIPITNSGSAIDGFLLSEETTLSDDPDLVRWLWCWTGLSGIGIEIKW